jgi:hypothetical protein
MAMARLGKVARTPAAVVIGIAVGLIGFWVGAHIDTASNGEAGILIGYVAGAAGFLITLGFADDLLLRLRGRPSAVVVKRPSDFQWTEYLGISMDHKVVAMQFGAAAVLIAVALALVLFL